MVSGLEVHSVFFIEGIRNKNRQGPGSLQSDIRFHARRRVRYLDNPSVT